MVIAGLSDDEQVVLNRLVDQLRAKRPRNELRSAFMDARHLLNRMPPTVPEYIRDARLVLGWPSKGVEALARRTKLEGFVIPGLDLSVFGLDSILDDNDYVRESRVAHVGSLEHGPEFLVATRGAAGEPEVVITRRSALDGTGDWNPRTRHLESFLSVVEWGKDGNPDEFNLYLPGVTILCRDGEVQERSEHALNRIPVEPLVYKARDGRPFGSSRITRPVMAITNSAVRTLMRSEGTADFYSAPSLALLGADEDTFSSSPGFRMLMSGMLGIPDAEDGENGGRVDLEQIQQASQEPHVKQLEMWAQLFASEMNIPVASLGIGSVQANPTSAESYTASREDLIDEAEDTADGWSLPHVRTLQNAWMLAEGESSVPSELLKLRPVWRPADRPTRQAESDWFLKTASVLPWVAETDTAIDMIGATPAMAERLRADRKGQQGRALLRSLGGEQG